MSNFYPGDKVRIKALHPTTEENTQLRVGMIGVVARSFSVAKGYEAVRFVVKDSLCAITVRFHESQLELFASANSVVSESIAKSNPTCDTCKWWIFGDCRRNPPQTVAVPARQFSDNVGLRNDPARLDTVWPATQPDDFCGEHKERTV